MDGSSSENLTACRILPQYNWPLFQMSFFLMSYLLPLMLICFFYICMLIRLWRTDRVSAESRRGRKRVTRLVFVVVGVFAFCWCPIQVSLTSFPRRLIFSLSLSFSSNVTEKNSVIQLVRIKYPIFFIGINK